MKVPECSLHYSRVTGVGGGQAGTTGRGAEEVEAVNGGVEEGVRGGVR